MAYRNKTYVCFDADTDMHYYRLMHAWKENEKIDFDFYDAHEINNLMKISSEDTIKRKLRERLLNSKILVVLIGQKTKNLHTYVRWEMEQAIKLDLPIIAVNLNKMRQKDEKLCPPILRNELAVHISFEAKILEYALSNWINEHPSLRKSNISESRLYPTAIYKSLGI